MCDISDYQKVAALVCLDIDTVVKAAKAKPELAIDLLVMLKERKDDLVNIKKVRDGRYSATVNIFTLST